MNGGQLIAEVLKAQGVPFLFTLVGGHISPILVAAKRAGIRVIDTRHEATAVFAADATARLTGRPGVAAVTAGPGVTNTLTAVKNAQMAQSPVIVIGGAAPTALQGRGALQDIDQMSLFTSVVKWSKAVRRVKDLVPALEEAFRQAQSGVPGPVFVECPVDLLYDESMVRKLYGTGRGGKSIGQKAVNAYLTLHVNRMFAGAEKQHAGPMIQIEPLTPDADKVAAVAERLQRAQRPVLIVGSQATLDAAHVAEVAAALERIGAPVYLSGMARGLLGRDHPLQLRHKRREALKEADLVLLAGVPADFRLDYGNHIRRSAFYVSANRSAEDLNKNRKPDIGVLGDPGLFLRQLAGQFEQGDRWPAWLGQLRSRDAARNDEIARQALEPVTDERAGASPAPTPFAMRQPVAPVARARPRNRPPDHPRGRRRRLCGHGLVHGSAARPADLAGPRPVRHVGCRRGLCPGRQAVPARSRGVDPLRRRLGRLQPGRVRHLRAPRRGRHRPGRQRRQLVADRARAG